MGQQLHTGGGGRSQSNLLKSISLQPCDFKFAKFWKLHKAQLPTSSSIIQQKKSANGMDIGISGGSGALGDLDQNVEFPANSASTAATISVFEFDVKILDAMLGFELSHEQKEVAVACAERALRRVKQLRHPGVIKYMESFVYDDDQDKSTDQAERAKDHSSNSVAPVTKHILLATEHVAPLREVLPTLDRSEVLLGLHQIATVLDWIHTHCHIVHNSVHIDSIYVTMDKQRRWLLGDFQFALDFNNELAERTLKKLLPMRHSEMITPEDHVLPWRKYLVHSRDAWGFGKLISEIGSISGLDNLPSSLPLLDNRPLNRQKLAQTMIYKGDVFSEVMTTISNLQTKTSAEKEIFFRQLFNLVSESIPQNLFIKRILPRMLTIPFVTEPASACFLPFLFSSTRGVLPGEEWRTHVMPFLVHCFDIRNRALRSKILSVLEYYITDMDEEWVMGKMMDEVIVSAQDTNDDLVSYGANAMVLVAKLLAKRGKFDQINEKIVCPLHHLAVCESNSEALRSHSLLCLLELWNIPKIDKRILLSAVQYTLYHPQNYEIKIHTINVLLVNLHRFDPPELASIIMKLVLDFTLHEQQEVRLKANQFLSNALKCLAEHTKNTLQSHNYGMLSNQQRPSPVVKIDALFPVESAQPISRKNLFFGKGPRIKDLVVVSEDDTDHFSPGSVPHASPNQKQASKSQADAQESLRDDEEEWDEDENWDNEEWDEDENEIVEGDEEQLSRGMASPTHYDSGKKGRIPQQSDSEEEEEEEQEPEPDYFQEMGLDALNVEEPSNILEKELKLNDEDLSGWGEDALIDEALDTPALNETKEINMVEMTNKTVEEHSEEDHHDNQA